LTFVSLVSLPLASQSICISKEGTLVNALTPEPGAYA